MAMTKTDQPRAHDASGAEPVEVTRREQTPAEPWRPTFTPPIDIHESEDGLVLEADLPGVTQENLSIRLEDNILVIDGQVDHPLPGLDPAGFKPLDQEYRVGDYHRSFILSDEVDRSRISADLHAGVLRLVLPKAERAKTRRITVKSASGSEHQAAKVQTSSPAGAAQTAGAGTASSTP